MGWARECVRWRATPRAASSRSTPQGRKAARVSELWRVREGSPLPVPTRPAIRRAGCRRAPLGFRGGPRPVPQVPARDVRRGHRPGARHRAAAAGAAQRPGQPRLPLLRAARLRQDHVGAHPGPLAQLRAGPDRRPVRGVRLLRRAGRRRPRLDRRDRDRRREPRRRRRRPRPARARVLRAGAVSRYKIYIIDEAHMVTTQGFNALLKLVEEPPEHIRFIFATTEPDKVLRTIRSRTHHYPFRLIPPRRCWPTSSELCAEEGVAGRAGGAAAGGPRRRRAPCATRSRCSTSCSAAPATDGVTYARAAGAARLHPRRAARRGGRRVRRR